VEVLAESAILDRLRLSRAETLDMSTPTQAALQPTESLAKTGDESGAAKCRMWQRSDQSAVAGSGAQEGVADLEGTTDAMKRAVAEGKAVRASAEKYARTVP